MSIGAKRHTRLDDECIMNIFITYMIRYDLLGSFILVYKWEILDKFTDSLRRQFGEGLHILEACTIIRKLKFNRNIICMLEVPEHDFMTVKKLRGGLET